MRAALLAAVVPGTTATTYTMFTMEAFSCGNTHRQPWHAVYPWKIKHSAEMSWMIAGTANNNANHYSSASCLPGGDAVPFNTPGSGTFQTIDACVTQCKGTEGRNCATKIWPEHCDQGCEKDCYAFQESPSTPSPRWSTYAIDDTSAADPFHVYVVQNTITLQPGNVGTAFNCAFTTAELLAAGPQYCVMLSTGPAKFSVWPDFNSYRDEIGQPWIKMGVSQGNALPNTAAGVAGLASSQGEFVHNPTTTGTTTATVIQGTITLADGATPPVELSCTDRCGAFVQGWGPLCNQPSSFGDSQSYPITWKPTIPSDCYCSCTSDCLIVGDCCPDYNLCSGVDLTAGGSQVQTNAPTKNNIGGASGDPFTEHAGKRVQFYLPLGRRVPLLRHHDLELFGEAKPSKLKNDDQQWFKGFEVRYKDDPIIIVEVVDGRSLLHEGALSELTSTANANPGDFLFTKGDSVWVMRKAVFRSTETKHRCTVADTDITRIKVHYDGFAEEFDEWLDIGSPRLLGKASRTTPAPVPAAERTTERSSDALDELRDRLARAKLELAKTSVMRDEAVSDEIDIDAVDTKRKILRSSNMPLTTLNITAGWGNQVQREVTSLSLANDAVNVQVAQDKERRIGRGWMESVWIEAPGIGFVLQSALAQKFQKEEDKIEHIHLNLKFNQLNATDCTGVLPEIWGVVPMAAETIKLLAPTSAKDA